MKDEGKGEENPKLSISFNSDGTPLTINYNNQFAYNIAARTTSENYHTVLWNDPAFRELYNIAVDALQEQGLDRGILKFGDVPYEKQETAKPESSYTAIYTAVPLGERKHFHEGNQAGNQRTHYQDKAGIGRFSETGSGF